MSLTPLSSQESATLQALIFALLVTNGLLPAELNFRENTDKEVNFKDFSRPKRNQVLFKDLNRIEGASRELLKFKTFSRL